MTGPPAPLTDTPDQLVARARAVWIQQAGAPVAFPSAAGIRMVVSPSSRLCPPSWVGFVMLGTVGIATAPDERALAMLTAPHLSLATFVDLRRLCRALPVTAFQGPATLAYLAAADFRPVADPSEVEVAPPRGPDLTGLLAGATEREVTLSGLANITSGAFVIRDDDAVVAAAGYAEWPGSVAHLCVLTAPAARARGLARRVASAATADALSRGLLPQWRAEPPPSRRVAAALGFRQLGIQFGIRLADG